MLLGSKQGICEMRLDPYRATLTDHEIDEDLHIVASSRSFPLAPIRPVPYSLDGPKATRALEQSDIDRMPPAGFE